MNSGYTVVEETLVPHRAFNDAVSRVRQCFTRGISSPDPICIAVVGESRSGKSRVLEEVLSEHLATRNSDGQIVPILRVTADSRPTIKGMASRMLKELGDPRWSTGTENQLSGRLEDQLIKCRTQMIMMDEFHHFFDKGTNKVFHSAADWLKTLVDATKVALVVAGIESCLSVLNCNEQLIGRFLAPATMPRFNWLVDDQRKEFISILEAFNKSMSESFDMPQLHSDDMAFRFWYASGGLMGYLTKILRQAVWDAIETNRGVLTLEDYATAHKKAVWQDSGDAIVTSPFDRKFSMACTQENIARAFAVGVRSELPEPPKARARKSKKVPIGQLLKGSGNINA